MTLRGGGQTANQVEAGVGAAAQAIGTVFPVAGAVLELADQIASLFGNTHPIGNDYFIGLPANGGEPFTDNETPQSGTNSAIAGNDLVELLGQVFASWRQQGAILLNPPLVIEIRDDGTPGMLFHPQYVQQMPVSEQQQYNLPGGLILTNGWNDRDSSQYWSLGPIAQVAGMVTALYNVFQSNGWIKVSRGAANTTAANVAPSRHGPGGALLGTPNPTMPTIATASSGVSAMVPPLLSQSSLPLLALGAVLLVALLK